ncbi:MAG TPA: DUF1015 family protein [Syntrophales bacterium]|nr:DUF1015 family protein [Syntrophales bacterium]
MSIVVPFKALRPKRQFVRAVSSYPYDVVSVKEAIEIVKDNPLNFLHVEKSEIDLHASMGANDESQYKIAKSNLDKLAQGNILFREKKNCFYIYRQKAISHEQYGIVAGISLAEYEAGEIRKHELTKADKELDRIRHVMAVDAQTGPVFVTYRARDFIDRMVKKKVESKPEYDFVSEDGISHTVWVISAEKDIADLIKAFAEVRTLYIADGHHRAAAAAAVRRLKKEAHPGGGKNEPYEYVMAVLFPHNQLKIMSYNRAMKDLNGLNEAEFLRRVRERFLVSDNFAEKSPAQFHDIGMYLGARWYKLYPKDNTYDKNDPIKVLDVSILQDNLLAPILGIQNPRTDERIEYIGGIRGVRELERLVNSGEFAVAFSLFPTTMEQLMAVADAGKVMPPKSTWFEPKLRSGIFIYLLTS